MKRFVLLCLAPLLVAAADPATETEHVVAEGETLGGIANRAKVPLAVIAAANGLVEPYSVREGQVLQIPRQRRHKVKRGETGFSIAMQYGQGHGEPRLRQCICRTHIALIGSTRNLNAALFRKGEPKDYQDRQHPNNDDQYDSTLSCI